MSSARLGKIERVRMKPAIRIAAEWNRINVFICLWLRVFDDAQCNKPSAVVKSEKDPCAWASNGYLSPNRQENRMNIHHLELFYYVAKHGGISEAVRNIPYGIQQPAVSGQVIQLEEFLGVTLFQRRPFALTPAGKDLYDFIHPFFENIS